MDSRDREVTPTELRADLYRVIDRVLATGQPCRVRRGDRTVLLVAESEPRLPWDFENRPFRPVVVGDPDAIVEGSPAEWNGEGGFEP